MQEFSRRKQNRVNKSRRKALAYVARRFFRVPTVEIASVLGRDATTISHMIERIRGKEAQMPEVIQCLKVLQDRAGGQSQ